MLTKKQNTDMIEDLVAVVAKHLPTNKPQPAIRIETSATTITIQLMEYKAVKK